MEGKLMFIDLTLDIQSNRVKAALQIQQSAAEAELPTTVARPQHQMEGHVGTHFDVMDKEFPICSFKTSGRLVDISGIRAREVEVSDLVPSKIEAGDTVIFYTGYMDEFGYENRMYWKRSAELSDAAVSYLISKQIRLIALDAAGAQKPTKHQKVDKLCADNGIFIVENLDNVKALIAHRNAPFTVYTAPLKRSGLTGLPCRVIAEIDG
jgi:kynurenine formamidase